MYIHIYIHVRTFEVLNNSVLDNNITYAILDSRGETALSYFPTHFTQSFYKKKKKIRKLLSLRWRRFVFQRLRRHTKDKWIAILSNKNEICIKQVHTPTYVKIFLYFIDFSRNIILKFERGYDYIFCNILREKTFNIPFHVISTFLNDFHYSIPYLLYLIFLIYL